MNSAGIVVLGSINMDLVVRVPTMPRPGATVLGGTFFTNLGGKGANQAVAAARAAREKVAFIAAVGDDTYGRVARDTLADEQNLLLEHLRIVPNLATGVALITVDGRGENMISVASGANAAVTPADMDAIPAAVWRGAKLFLACLESPLPAVVRGLERAKEFGLMTVLNPAPAMVEAGRPEVLELVDVLTPNEAEAAALVGATGSTASVCDAARELQRRGAKQVVVTCGAQGCQLLGDGETHVAAHRVTAVDTTAAGDAFTGALAAALVEGRPLVAAVNWASVAAAISVTRPGAIASLATRSEIESLAGKP